MIKQLEIQNFQSHKQTVIDFDEGLNVIIGQSDCGKTAIIRALNLLMNNKPAGEAFRSTWGGDTLVKGTFDGFVLERKKTNSKNLYKLNDKEFVAFGQDVPDEIKEVLNISDINLQSQMDKPFLISETSGTIASHFNKVANLDVIDNGLQYIQKKINSFTSDIKYNEKDIKEKNEKLNQFPDIDGFEKDLETIEKLEIKLQFKEQEIKKLKSIDKKLENVKSKISNLSVLTKYEIKVNQILEKIENRKQKEKNKKELRDLSLEIYYLQEDLKNKENILKIETRVNKLLKSHEQHTYHRTSLTKLSKLYKSILSNKKVQETALNQVSILEETYKNEFPDICPLCNTKL